MTIKKLVEELKVKPGYLKSSPTRVASRFKVSVDVAIRAIREAKQLGKTVDSLPDLANSNSNYNVITEF